MRFLAIAALFAATLSAQPKRILYITHSAGFAHGSIPHSVDVLRQIAQQSGQLEITATDDVSQINAATLVGYDAVLFFTSGELPISNQQKADLLAFVRSGKGFGGFHSATDTFYQWPEYGEMIGGYFNGHPWTQEVTVGVEDTANPIVSHLNPSFRIQDEIYQFREFSRSRVRVLLKLDVSSVDLNAPGVNPNTRDFPLVWIRPYQQGRVFYSALGHFDEVWDDSGVRQMLRNAMLWLTGQIEAEASPRASATPVLTPAGVANAANYKPAGTIAAGSLISIFGENLTSGSIGTANLAEPVYDLAGTTVRLNGEPLPLIYASPGQVNAYVPFDRAQASYQLAVAAAGDAAVAPVPLAAADATPGIFVQSRILVNGQLTAIVLWCTGLGPVERRSDGLDWTVTQPTAVIGGLPAPVLYSGLAPGYPGLYQVNLGYPPLAARPTALEFRFGSYIESIALN